MTTDNTDALPPLPSSVFLTMTERAALYAWRDASVAAALAAAPPAQQQSQPPRSIIITLRQARELVELFGGADSEVVVTKREAGEIQPDHDDEDKSPSPAGLWAHFAEYPEEGSMYLGPTEVDDSLEGEAQQQSAQPEQQPVAWRREWQGDDSDIGAWVYASAEDDLDGEGPWQQLYATQPHAVGPLPEFECANQYAAKRGLAFSREWVRGWDACTDYIEELLRSHGIGKQEGK